MHFLPFFFSLLGHFLSRTSAHLHLLPPSPAIYSPGLSKRACSHTARGWGVGGAQRMSDKTCSVLPRHLSEPRLSCAGMEMSRSDTTRQIGAGAPAGSLVICRFSLFRCFSSRLLFINRLHPSARHTCRSAHCASAARRFCAASPQTWPTEAAVSVQTVA